MKRFYIYLSALLALPASAQTTLDITVPGPAVCSYITGPVTNGVTSGHLQATATSSSGAGCGTGSSGNVTFGPASPLSPQSTQVQTGNSVSYSFQALNATSCSASITGAASGSFTGGNTLCSGTGASTCSNRLVTASASFTNTTQSPINDNVTLTCTGTSGQAQSVATVTVNSGINNGASCPTVVPSNGVSGVSSFTQQHGNTTILIGGDRHQASVDITQWNSVFGAFPGNINTAYDTLPVDNYISLQFQGTGLFGNFPLDWAQPFAMGTSNMDTRVSMSISTTCGDFRNPATVAQSTVVKNCYKTNVVAQGQILGYGPTSDPLSLCVLQDGTPYFWNIINADTSNLTSTGGTAQSYRDHAGSKCTTTTCTVPIQDNSAGSFIP